MSSVEWGAEKCVAWEKKSNSKSKRKSQSAAAAPLCCSALSHSFVFVYVVREQVFSFFVFIRTF